MPTHELDGTDYATVSSHRAAKDSDPATVNRASDFNSLWRGLMTTYLAEGMALLADGAADQTAGWVALDKALRRMARRMLKTAVQVDGTLVSVDLTLDMAYVQLISDGTDRPGAEIDLPNLSGLSAPDRALYAGLLVTVSNETLSPKYLLGSDNSGEAPLVRLGVGRAVTFQGILRDSGARIAWEPVTGLDPISITLSCKLYRSSDNAASSAFNIVYSVDALRKVTHLSIYATPNLAVTGSDSSVTLKQADGTALPAALMSAVEQVATPVIIRGGTSGDEVGQMGDVRTTTSLVGSGGTLVFSRIGSVMGSGNFAMRGIHVSFLNNEV